MLNPEEALNKIAERVLLQAMYDYVRLQSQKSRKKTYLKEAFMNSVDMFHDEEYRLAAFKVDDQYEMDLKEFIMLATNRENVNLDELYKYLHRESKTYWGKKDKEHMHIPDILTVNTTPWTTDHRESGYFIDFDERCIHVNKKTDDGKNDFLQAILDILFDELEIIASASKRKAFALALRQTLKLNNNFK